MADERSKGRTGDKPADETTPAPPEPKAAAEEPTEDVERLLRDAGDLFDQPTYVVAGALEHAKLAHRKNLTRSEVKAAIKDFLAHEVVGEE